MANSDIPSKLLLSLLLSSASSVVPGLRLTNVRVCVRHDGEQELIMRYPVGWIPLHMDRKTDLWSRHVVTALSPCGWRQRVVYVSILDRQR